MFLSLCSNSSRAEYTEDPFAGLDVDDEVDATARLQELVDQLGSDITTDEYMAAADDLCTCVSFDDSDKWKEKLQDMVCDDIESSAKIPAVVQDDDSDDEEEPGPWVGGLRSWRSLRGLDKKIAFFY